jgi:uncharacterized protein YchJ
MLFDFLFRKKKQAAEHGGKPAVVAENKPKTKETIEERIEREMSALPSFVKNKIKDPTVKQKFIELAKKMEKDGTDMNSPRAMKKWVKEHEQEIKREQQSDGKVETIVKGEETGRNEPCPCGSGKKYKKCCGA